MHSYFPGEVPVIEAGTILYVEQGQHPLMNSLLKNNYRYYYKLCRENNLTLVYLPGLEDLDDSALNDLANQLLYLYPKYYNLKVKGLRYLLHLLFNRDPGDALFRQLSEILNIKRYPDCGFLIFPQAVYLGKKTVHREYDLSNLDPGALNGADADKNLHRALEMIFRSGLEEPGIAFASESRHILWEYNKRENRIEESHPAFQIKDPEDKFAEELSQVEDEILKNLEQYIKTGKKSLLLNLLVHFFDEIRIHHPELLKELETKLGMTTIEGEPHHLSTLHLQSVAAGTDFKILLPDYDLVIDMTPLCKSLYLFFLLHPEGVRLKELGDYHQELSLIYGKFSNLSDLETIQKNVERLTDVVNDNSIHVNCARIKSAFLSKMNDYMARHYYINGQRGRPKKIFLPSDHITIDPLILDYIRR